MFNVTCLACGCLCDDIRVVIDGGRIVEAERACAIGRRWFLADRPDEGKPVVTIDGQPAELAQAIDRAAEILGSAKAPIVWGLTETTIEAVASALAIADRIGAVVDLAGGQKTASRLEAYQRVGQVSASLGEVRDRADVVVFWGVDPLKTHPRHWERYSVEPQGRFIPEGRAGRFVIVVDSQPSETSHAADLFVKIDRTRQAEALEVLRALIRGIAIDPDHASQSAGIPFFVLEELANRLKSARYGAMFFEPFSEPNDSISRTVESLLKLVRDLNEGRRFVALEMGSPGNAPGAASVLSWQAGAASSVDYSLGFPRHLPREATLQARLESGEVDAVLMVVGAEWANPGTQVLGRISQIPTILIGHGTIDQAGLSVTFRTARPGLEGGGTVARVDGLMLSLRPAVASALPIDRQVLNAICERLEMSELKTPIISQ
jgi:formylmethanofuran dehydrogenase subunit B